MFLTSDGFYWNGAFVVPSAQGLLLFTPATKADMQNRPPFGRSLGLSHLDIVVLRLSSLPCHLMESYQDLLTYPFMVIYIHTTPLFAIFVGYFLPRLLLPLSIYHSLSALKLPTVEDLFFKAPFLNPSYPALVQNV